MSPMLTDALHVLGAVPGLAFIAKATCILLVGFAALALAARARAATRHAIVACTFAALVALPAVLWISPGFTVNVPARTPLPAVVVPSATPGVVNAPRTDVTITNGSRTVTPRTPLVTGERIVELWIIGALLTIAPFAFGLYQMRRLRRTSMPWTGDRALVAALARNAGVHRPVELLVHENISTPLMSGVLSPAVLLPGGAIDWSGDELRCALTHELEHVRRGDWLVHVIARGVCAVYWFHPLVWMAWRRLAVEAERSCDDAVLQNADQTEYAEQLVSLARRLSGSAPQPLMAMANRSDLSTRVSAVLDSSQARGRLRSLPAIGALIVTAVITTAMSPVRVVSTAIAAPARMTTDTDCRPSLLRAAARGNVESLATQIAQGADVNCTEDGDGTPLIIAARSGHVQAVQLMLANGADPNLAVSGDGNPIIMAARKGHIGIVRLLLDHHADPNLGVPGDGNALIAAAGAGHIDVAQLLLDRGARIDEVVDGDENALIQASAEGRIDVVRLLIGRGANVNARVWVAAAGWQGVGEWRSPLSMARRGGHDATVIVLLGAGAKQ